MLPPDQPFTVTFGEYLRYRSNPIDSLQKVFENSFANPPKHIIIRIQDIKEAVFSKAKVIAYGCGNHVKRTNCILNLPSNDFKLEKNQSYICRLVKWSVSSSLFFVIMELFLLSW